MWEIPPDTSSPAPDTTIPAQDTFILAPQSSIVAPQSSIAAPESSIAVPFSSITAPESTAAPNTSIPPASAAAEGGVQHKLIKTQYTKPDGRCQGQPCQSCQAKGKGTNTVYFCPGCEDKPFLCRTCFNDRHIPT